MTNQPGMTPSAALRGAVDLGALAAARDAEQKAAARRADPGAPAVIIDVTEATFQSDVLEMSQTVPVVVDLWASWCGPCKTLSPILERLAEEYAGRWILAKVDVDAEQNIAAAFRVQSIPTIMAVLKGQVLPLFQGALPEPQVRQYLDELLNLAAQHGVTGTREAAPAAEPEPAGEDPRWEQAEQAIDDGQWAQAKALFEELTAVDAERAGAALQQVGLLARIDGVDPDAVLADADADPSDPVKAASAADVELAQGRLTEAFDRMVAVIRVTSGPDRDSARRHLLELFALVGESDPAVQSGRAKLASALF